ncbi:MULTISPECIES: DUF885 domain-containing protein [unclassified Saccharopolyspora]|uniref:DUF885 domain-containing protein n=1 Tax=Saccharopolyspora TaxID=1835 RepID=UPI00190E356A|nr:DUF885 domain-containing protein [Saccharopolyspora sp. HNM0986]MBK0866674.1 DUF885 domain-containing protein [Saccharopolyspora sp. HNM0986]
MDAHQVVNEYVLLGLRLDRLEPGAVEAFAGDPLLRHRAAREAPPAPSRLVASVQRLRAALPGCGLSAPREEFITAQLPALECTAHRLAGRELPLADTAERCFQVHPRPGDPDDYRRVHAELAAVLPGRGDPAIRLARLRAAEAVPADSLSAAVSALSRALRAQARAEIGLPAQESVRFRLVRDRPWTGLHRYLGDFRSLVAVNADHEHWAGQLPWLVAHESYPGHHTDQCRKESASAQRPELALALRDTPQSVISEGLADLGLRIAVGPGWGRWAAEVLAGAGVAMDGELAERVQGLLRQLSRVRWDAALLLHDRGADAGTAVRHLRRWGLMSERRARALVEFLADRRRAVRTAAYVEGGRLVGSWLGACPARGDRVRRLLDEAWTPRALARELGCLPQAEAGCSVRR